MTTAPKQPDPNDDDLEQQSTPAGLASDLEEEAADTGASTEGDEPETEG